MKRSLTAVTLVITLIAGGGAWYIHSKQPVRQGEMTLVHLQAPVTVRYDERGVPHGAIKSLEPFGIAVLVFRDPHNIQIELTAPMMA